MPRFDTPTPIAVTVEVGVGAIQIRASRRTDTVVEVRPTDPEKRVDVAAAEQARVEYADGRLLIRAAKGWKKMASKAGRESVDVRIDLPEESHVKGEGGITALRSTGRLGECRYRTGLGDIDIEEASSVELKAGAGDISVGRTAGPAEIATASGAMRVGTIDGAAVIKNSNGDTWIGEVTGDLRVHSANGKIAVDQARSGVVAKTAKGDVRLGQVTRGTVLVQTAFGKVDIGIREGVVAWLDLDTGFGQVRNDLNTAEGPQSGEEAVEVRARTGFGDITIHRPPASDVRGAA